MRRLGLFFLVFFDGVITTLTAICCLITFLAFLNKQWDGGFTFLILSAVLGYIGWLVFNRAIDGFEQLHEMATRTTDNSTRAE